MNINKAIVCGRIAKDIELKTTPSGTVVTSFSIATNYKFKDNETTEFHNVVVWGKLAEVIEKYCSKGDEIYVEGRLQTREWEGKNGKQRRTEIIVSEMQFGQKKKGSQRSNSISQSQKEEVTDEFAGVDDNVEDIPF